MENTQIYEACPSRSEQTQLLTRGVIRMFINLGLSPLGEFKLANGRRADLAAFDRQGRLTIVEVKSCRADFEADQKWPDYLGFCDRFYFAVDLAFPVDILPREEGLIVADAYGATVKRPANVRTLAPTRRKAVTLRFARQAARRCLSGSVMDDRYAIEASGAGFCRPARLCVLP